MSYTGKIYALKSSKTDDIYIGSTKNTIITRFSAHKSNYKLYLQGKHKYVTSFELCKYDDVYVELIENYNCSSKKELERREGEIQREMKCVNQLIAGRTRKEHLKENEDFQRRKIGYGKTYREKNRIAIYERRKIKEMCECGSTYSKDSRARHLRSKKHISYLNLLN